MQKHKAGSIKLASICVLAAMQKFQSESQQSTNCENGDGD